MNKRRSLSESLLLEAMKNNPDNTVVACGIVEVRAADRLVEEGLAERVSESTDSVDRWGAGSAKLKLKD